MAAVVAPFPNAAHGQQIHGSIELNRQVKMIGPWGMFQGTGSGRVPITLNIGAMPPKISGGGPLKYGLGGQRGACQIQESALGHADIEGTLVCILFQRGMS
jgi:hypothetical protein